MKDDKKQQEYEEKMNKLMIDDLSFQMNTKPQFLARNQGSNIAYIQLQPLVFNHFEHNFAAESYQYDERDNQSDDEFDNDQNYAQRFEEELIHIVTNKDDRRRQSVCQNS